MRIDRRTLLTATTGSSLLATSGIHAQTPSPVASPQAGIPPLETGDVQVMSISPDGSTLFSVSKQDEIVFLAVDSLEEISRSEGVPEVGVIDSASVSWSPDSSRVAFSLNAWILAIDSDIFVATAATGETINTTPEGHKDEAGSMLETSEGPLNIDMSPVWLDDGTILFARHQMNDELMLTLMSMTVETGGVETWLEFDPAEVSSLTNLLTLLDDGRVAFSGGDDGMQPIIVLASQDGEVEIVDTGGVQTPFPRSLGNSTAVIHDPRKWEDTRISYDGSSEPELINDIFELEEGIGIIAGPEYGPDGESLVGVTLHDQRVVIADADGTRDVGSVEGEISTSTVTWVDGLVLVAGRAGAWLIPVP